MEEQISISLKPIGVVKSGVANPEDVPLMGKSAVVEVFPEYSPASRFNHEPRRPRKLLLHKREMMKLAAAVQRKGVTPVPLSIYFNDKGRAKVELALATGKRQHDKRTTIKERDWQRDKARLLRGKK